MNKARFIFDAYDDKHLKYLNKEQFITFLYELGHQEIFQDQFNDSFALVNTSNTGKITYEEFEDGVLALSELDFIPLQTREKPRIDPTSSPWYYLYEQMIENDENEFRSDESGSEDEDGESVAEDEEDSLAISSPPSGKTPVSKAQARANESPASQSPSTMKRPTRESGMSNSPHVTHSPAAQRDSPKASPFADRRSITPSITLNRSPGPQRKEIVGVNGGDKSPIPQKRFAAVDDTGLSPSLSRAKFAEDAKKSPNLPRPSNATAQALSAASPDLGLRPYRNRVSVALSNSPRMSPSMRNSPKATDSSANDPSGDRQQVTAPQAKIKREVVITGLATAARNTRISTMKPKQNFAVPQVGSSSPATTLTRSKKNDTDSPSTRSTKTSQLPIVNTMRGPVVNIAAAPTGVTEEPEWMKNLRAQKKEEKEHVQQREESVPLWLRQLKAEKEAAKKQQLNEQESSNSPKPEIRKTSTDTRSAAQ